jgi:hypothetical protein
VATAAIATPTMIAGTLADLSAFALDGMGWAEVCVGWVCVSIQASPLGTASWIANKPMF